MQVNDTCGGARELLRALQDDKHLRLRIQRPASGKQLEEDTTVEGQVTIDFVILPEGYGSTKQLSTAMTIANVRRDLENELRVDEGSLCLVNMFGACGIREELLDTKTLYQLGLRPGDSASIELRMRNQAQPAEDCRPDNSTEGVPTAGLRTKGAPWYHFHRPRLLQARRSEGDTALVHTPSAVASEVDPSDVGSMLDRESSAVSSRKKGVKMPGNMINNHGIAPTPIGPRLQDNAGPTDPFSNSILQSRAEPRVHSNSSDSTHSNFRV
jgi:hypothetical protein